MQSDFSSEAGRGLKFSGTIAYYDPSSLKFEVLDANLIVSSVLIEGMDLASDCIIDFLTVLGDLGVDTETDHMKKNEMRLTRVSIVVEVFGLGEAGVLALEIIGQHPPAGIVGDVYLDLEGLQRDHLGMHTFTF